MKKFAALLFVGILGGAIALGIQQVITPNNLNPIETSSTKDNSDTPNFIPTNTLSTISASNVDFTDAAEKTVNAVVHVKNVTEGRVARNYMDFLRNGGGKVEKAIVGAGSGVIITGDGYIVTNYHVIDGSSEIQVSLNNNKSYAATLVGFDKKADIALLKIESSEEKFSYIPFGDSDNTKIGEWVLAVGNPFNLTSTVTAGIISAKARDLNEFDTNLQSFIQTDAAINPGNSGGALVNTLGELIGINTAITSQTGSYVGYAFAVPSNNARKIVEDILEYGDVQRGILGISGGSLNQSIANKLGINDAEGVIISTVSKDSGAEKSGLKKGDIIKEIDGNRVRKFSDLTGYISSKRPNDIINVRVLRDKKMIELPVTLTKYESYQIEDVGVEVVNATDEELAEFGTDYGVKISQALNPSMKRYGVEGIIITEINNQKVNSVADVKKIIKSKNDTEDVMVSFLDRSGEKKHFVFN